MVFIVPSEKNLKYGFGFGGPCFPRDNRAFGIFAKEVNIDATISKEGQAIIGNNTALGMCNPRALADINPDYNAIYDDVYSDVDAYFAKNPMPDGMPVDNDGGYASHKDWLRAWDKFKAL